MFYFGYNRSKGKYRTSLFLLVVPFRNRINVVRERKTNLECGIKRKSSTLFGIGLPVWRINSNLFLKLILINSLNILG